MEIGVQFYTLRKHCETLEDFAASLKRVAEMGYKNVQISGTCAYEPQWLKEQLERNGLRCVLTHISRDRLMEEPEKVLEDHRIFDCPLIGMGAPYSLVKEGEEAFQKTLQLIDKAAPLFRDNGSYFMYHHHAMEFIKDAEGRTYYERLLERYDAATMGVTLDTFWLQMGGQNPAKIIRSLKGRIPAVHLKDFGVIDNKTFKMMEIGYGNLDWDEIFAACADSEVKYLLVEQDDCNGEDPFECLQRSYEFLKKRGF